MKKLLLLILVLNLAFGASAQSYLPIVEEGKYWSYQYNSGLGTSFYRTYHSVCDTTINGKQYKKLTRDMNGTLWGFVREDTLERSVYFLTYDTLALLSGLDTGIDILTAKYGMSVGDTFTANGYHFEVDTIYQQNMHGRLRTVWGCGQMGAFVEGIGNLGYGILGEGHNTGYPYFNGNLINFKENDITCASLSVKNLKTLKASIFPNPVSDRLSIQLEAGNTAKHAYMVYDVMGRVVKSGDFSTSTTTQSISTAELSAGSYFITIINEDAVYNGKFVKQ